MSDLTETIYSPNDVVWVKLGPVWWPAQVCGQDEIPPEIMKDLRKTPIAIVKFFQEDSYEYVKSLSNIYHYHCARKDEFIKKGLDMLTSKNRMAPSNMTLFPEDIVRAENMTDGDPYILQRPMFLPEERPTYTDLFATKKTPKKAKPAAKKKQTPVKPRTPRLITHPRFLQLSSGQSTDYEVREREQIPVRAECDVEDTSPPTSYSCTECDYTTTRLNVMVWHNKSHTRNYASPRSSKKATKRKSTASVKLKERSSVGSPAVEAEVDDLNAVSAAKIPKTNGTLKAVRSPKTAGRKKSTAAAAKKTPSSRQNTPGTKETNSTPTVRMRAKKGRRVSVDRSDEIHKSLLEDWLEDDIIEQESAGGEAADENTAPADGSAASGDSKNKSCFDFDDSEDHLVIDKSKFTPGRKIPRLVNKSATSTLAADDVVAMSDSADSMDVDATAAESTREYQSGVEDGVNGESPLGCSQTSQLQEMGVDNEIEIQTEKTPVSKVVIKSMPPKKNRRILKTEAKVDDVAELHDKVDELLNEISKAPTKLPDIPRSHKKAQLKAYQQQAEAEEQAAQKAAAEAEAARKTAAEAEAAQKAAAEAEVAQKAAAEAEAAQKAAADAEAAQKTAAEAKAAQKATAAEAAQKAAAEAEAAQKVVAEAEAAKKAAAEAEATKKVAADAKAAKKVAAEVEAAKKAATEAKAAQKATAAEAARKVAAEAEAAQKATAEAEAAKISVAQKAAAEKETAEKIIAAQQKVEEQVAYDVHPEMMDIEVSSIPLPSPQKSPVTSEPVESSINIGASVTVAESGTVADACSSSSPTELISETLVSKNAAAGNKLVIEANPSNTASVDQKTSTESNALSFQPTSSAGVADASPTPAASDTKTLTNSTTPSKTKPVTPTPVLRSGQQTLKILSPSEYKMLMNKLSASASQVSPSKTSTEPLKTIKTTIKTASGKSFLCNLTQSPKMLLANSQSSNSPTKILILTNYKKAGPPATATTASSASAATTPTPAGRSTDLATSTTLRVTPNMLQKSAAQKVAAAALAKSTSKNIVLDASTFQSLFQPQQLSKVQSQLVLPEATAEPQASSSAAVSTAPSQSAVMRVVESGAPSASSNSNCAEAAVSSVAAGQTVDYNYIVDSSGNLVQVDEPIVSTPTRDKDILAKALESTDGLQTEMALSEATNSVLDSCSVAQNTELAYKPDTIYENLTINTAPIMSAYETPSRTVAGASNETMMAHGAAQSDEYIS
ncbi:hypothetical protein V9T40_006543 [Parthenolecanium corni]|uniref:PWWP domain-containing protein n=1 Tax=Parthenolecanium corni TaxID=536013 RepID=A0AAN9Y7I3_9HEMI